MDLHLCLPVIAVNFGFDGFDGFRDIADQSLTSKSMGVFFQWLQQKKPHIRYRIGYPPCRHSSFACSHQSDIKHSADCRRAPRVLPHVHLPVHSLCERLFLTYAVHRGRHGIIFGWAKYLFPLFPTLPNPTQPLHSPHPCPALLIQGSGGITPEKLWDFSMLVGASRRTFSIFISG
jgi:hypothetical protein